MPGLNSFTIHDEVFALRVDRSRVPERIRVLADIDTGGDPRLVLEAYRRFILGEIRYADRERWLALEERLELADIVELVAWIISPWTGTTSEAQALKAYRKALAEGVLPR